MARKPHLSVVSGGPPTEGELSRIRDATERMRRERKALDEYAQEMARTLRAQYEALPAEGFTASQALSIVKEQMK